MQGAILADNFVPCDLHIENISNMESKGKQEQVQTGN